MRRGGNRLPGGPHKVVTGSDGKVTGLICQKMELGEPDASGRRRPVPVAGAEFELPVDMIVPAIGQEPAQERLKDCGVKLSRWGTIEVDETTYQTSRPGVFAAGDVHTGPWIAIEAVGGGIEAAESIDRYLRKVDLAAGRTEGKEAHKRWAEIPKDEEGQPREAMAALPRNTPAPASMKLPPVIPKSRRNERPPAASIAASARNVCNAWRCARPGPWTIARRPKPWNWTWGR